MSRGVDGRQIFVDDQDRTTFLRMLVQEKYAHRISIFAYCLMGNHFHILLQIQTFPLYSSMHRLLTRYSTYFNHRHARQGHLFQSRYTAPTCSRESYFSTLLRYIHLNPVRAGLVGRPNEWPWSGHGGLTGERDDGILDLAALAAIREQTVEQLKTDYLELIESKSEPDHAMIDPTCSDHRPELRLIAARIARDHGFDPSDLRRKGRVFSPAKRAFIKESKGYGYPLTAIATELHCSPAAVTMLGRTQLNFVPDP